MTDDREQIAANLADAIRVVARVVRERYGGMKSINEVVRRYRDAFENVLYDAFNKRVSQSSLVAKLAAIIESNAGDAYREGMKQGGGDPDTDFTKDDQNIIDDWITTQINALAGFAQAAVDVRGADDKDVARAAILDRVDLWVDNLNMLGNLGAASQSDPMVTWVYGDADHCETCAGLNGKRHKLSWFIDKGYIPQERGSETLDCHGYHCQCKLVDAKGNQVMP